MNLANQPVREYSKQQQLEYNRKKPKRAKSGEFTARVRLSIRERDNDTCVRCGAPYDEIHHIIFRSQNGKGTVDNGCCVCRTCHQWAHSSKEGREWFEKWRDKHVIRHE